LISPKEVFEEELVKAHENGLSKITIELIESFKKPWLWIKKTVSNGSYKLKNKANKFKIDYNSHKSKISLFDNEKKIDLTKTENTLLDTLCLIVLSLVPEEIKPKRQRKSLFTYKSKKSCSVKAKNRLTRHKKLS
jgi:hypothetical protein